MRRLLYICIGIIVCNLTAYGQMEKSTLSNDSINRYSFVPPLSQLLDSAVANSAKVHFFKADVEKKKSDLKTEGREWLRYVSVGGEYRYGKFYALSVDEATEAEDEITGYNAVTQSRYSVGASVSIPLLHILNRGNAMKSAEWEITKAKSEIEWEAELIKRYVIEIHSQLLSSYKALVIAESNKISTSMQMQMAKKQFVNGEIDLIDYANLKQLELKALREYEEIAIECKSNKALLIEAVGFYF